MMKSVIELEEIIVQGLQIDPRNYSAVQNWLETTFSALAPFPEERHRLESSYFSWAASPEEKIEQGLQILNDAVDSLTYTRPDDNYQVECFSTL